MLGLADDATGYVVAAPDFGQDIPSPGLEARLAALFPAVFTAPPPVTERAPVMKLDGLAARLPDWEQAIILETATRKGIDPLALAAIRLAENGGPGKEFGVLSVSAPTYQAQADIAANSLKNSEGRYRDARGITPKDGAGRYTPDFWTFFAARWAPIDAANDPQGLNRYWLTNVTAFYQGSAVIG